MLWSIAFDRLGVVVSDLYFVDPNPGRGQEGPERGVRLELRRFRREPLRGSIYSAVPVLVEEPLWRVDLLESVTSDPGSLDRAHHHPRFKGWEPGRRVFVDALSADPVGWLRQRLASPAEILDDAGEDPARHPVDLEALAASASEICAAVERLLGEVAAGRAGRPPEEESGSSVRASWL